MLRLRAGQWMALAALLLALAVLLGAFGAHALRDELDTAALQTYQTAVDYHFWQAVGLFLLGLAASDGRIRVDGPAFLLLLALLFFSGSLYALALTGHRALGLLTPIGGLGFLLAWCWAAVILWRRVDVPRQASD